MSNSLSIRTLPIVERWDCHGCSDCCRGGIIPLDDDEVAKIRDQKWHEHPDFRHVRVLIRLGLLKRSYQLAKRDDGSCVFLTEQGRCRIHELHGEAAKPLVCRMFPFQLVPLGNFAYLTTRRSCPSAAADKGRPLKEHRRAAAKLVQHKRMFSKQIQPPRITRRCARTWRDFLLVSDVLARLLGDQRVPLVRRIVRGLRFCDLLELCRLQKLDGSQLSELLTVLEGAVDESETELFQDRQPPKPYAAVLFRQAAAQYVRLSPAARAGSSWRRRWRLSIAALAFARGRGDVPALHAGLPQTTFAALEQPLGVLPRELLSPLDAYFQNTAVSRQYAVLGRPGWSLVESFRALALSFPIALWLLRYASVGRMPTADDVIDAVTIVNRGQGYAPLVGFRQRRAIGQLANGGQLQRIAVWYAR